MNKNYIKIKKESFNMPMDKLLAILKDAYNYNNKIIKDNFSGISNHNYSTVKYAEYVVERFKSAYEALDQRAQIIIENEFFKNYKKQWYLDYFSKNTYYSIRVEAYEKFIDYLKG